MTLQEQDRTGWDRELVAEGQALVRECLAGNRSGYYQLLTAVNAVHTDAPTAAETDWSQIAALYDQLHAGGCARHAPGVRSRYIAEGSASGQSGGVMHGFGGWSGCDPDGVRRQGAPHRGVGWGAGWAGSPGPGHPFGQGHVQGGPPPWLAGLFGLGRPEVRRGARVRRGDVRAAILAVLQAAAERGEPVNGYQVIQQIADRTGGTWRPSPGSVYPTIQQLEDEGLVEADDERGRRTLRLTESGTAYVAERAEELAAVWQPFEEAETAEGERQPPGLKPEIGQVMGAVWQILTTGSEAQRRAAAEVLVETRRQLYGILADGDGFDTDRDSAKEDRR